MKYLSINGTCILITRASIPNPSSGVKFCLVMIDTYTMGVKNSGVQEDPMKSLECLLTSVLLGLALTLVACGSKVATLNDFPTYPGAVELKAGESKIADTLQKNKQQDALVRQAMNVGGKVEQRGFQLPKNTQWDAINSFYADKLKAAGWTSGLGGIAGQFVDINKVTSAANQSNSLFRTAIYTKNKQSLTIIFLTDPTNKKNKQLIFSLASN